MSQWERPAYGCSLLSCLHTGVAAVLTIYAVAGAMVPDLDAVESKIKHVKVMGIKPLVPVAVAINREFVHRKLLHSLRGSAAWTLLNSPFAARAGCLPVAALSLGDACTRTGIALFCPQRNDYHLLPVWLRVVTGSEAEEVFFVIFALISRAMLLRP
jgi:membrane-bound metal-dependent hydrolase YbcI (DUF457 family)